MIPILPARADETWMVLAPAGQLDLDSLPGLRKSLDELVCVGRVHVVVDLAGVSFLGEEALAIFVSVWRKLHAHGGRLRLVCGPGHALDQLRVSGLIRILPTYPTVAAALADP
jgi:anti-sigma B factor antagonist